MSGIKLNKKTINLLNKSYILNGKKKHKILEPILQSFNSGNIVVINFYWFIFCMILSENENHYYHKFTDDLLNDLKKYKSELYFIGEINNKELIFSYLVYCKNKKRTIFLRKRLREIFSDADIRLIYSNILSDRSKKYTYFNIK